MRKKRMKREKELDETDKIRRNLNYGIQEPRSDFPHLPNEGTRTTAVGRWDEAFNYRTSTMKVPPWKTGISRGFVGSLSSHHDHADKLVTAIALERLEIYGPCMGRLLKNVTSGGIHQAWALDILHYGKAIWFNNLLKESKSQRVKESELETLPALVNVGNNNNNNNTGRGGGLFDSFPSKSVLKNLVVVNPHEFEHY